MSQRRVVITGLGVISPNGIGQKEFWEACISGKSGIKKVSGFDVKDFPSQIAGEVTGFAPEKYILPKKLKNIDRFTQFGIVATKLALEDASLDISREDKERIGIGLGSAIGGIPFAEEQHTKFMETGLRRMHPLASTRLFPGNCASNISMELGINGYSTTISTGCTSGTDAVGFALEAIRNNRADIMLAGAAEAPLTPATYGSFCLIKVMSRRNDEPTKAARPFDGKRDGIVLSEGAAILVLEELDHAQKRGATIYCEIVGFGTTYDAYHITEPLPDSKQLIRAMSSALEDAGIAAEKLDYINAHGSSTILNDKFETLAIKRLLGDFAYKVPISATESMVGHPIGADGAIKLAATALSIKNGTIHPTINHECPDPDCDLDYVPNEKRAKVIKYAMSNSISFGGKNSVIVLAKYQ